jgi:hypothetical protein
MKNNRVILSAVLLVVALGSSGSQFAQETPTGAEKSKAQDRHGLALGFLRTINTAEVAGFAQYRSYASWQTLLAHDAQYLNGWVATYYSENPSVHFGDPPEILPGLRLRLNVHNNGQGYDVPIGARRKSRLSKDSRRGLSAICRREESAPLRHVERKEVNTHIDRVRRSFYWTYKS